MDYPPIVRTASITISWRPTSQDLNKPLEKAGIQEKRLEQRKPVLSAVSGHLHVRPRCFFLFSFPGAILRLFESY